MSHVGLAFLVKYLVDGQLFLSVFIQVISSQVFRSASAASFILSTSGQDGSEGFLGQKRFKFSEATE